MGIADRNPGQLVPFNCASAAVAEGAVLVMGATNDVVKLPTAASSAKRCASLNRSRSAVVSRIIGASRSFDQASAISTVGCTVSTGEGS